MWRRRLYIAFRAGGGRAEGVVHVLAAGIVTVGAVWGREEGVGVAAWIAPPFVVIVLALGLGELTRKARIRREIRRKPLR